MPKTPMHTVRIDDELWKRFGVAVGSDRSWVIRQFMRWYVGEPGAALPIRSERA